MSECGRAFDGPDGAMRCHGHGSETGRTHVRADEQWGAVRRLRVISEW